MLRYQKETIFIFLLFILITNDILKQEIILSINEYILLTKYLLIKNIINTLKKILVELSCMN
jgi:hypothetical protein